MNAAAKENKKSSSMLHLRNVGPLGMAWYAPTTLTDLLSILRSSPSATKKFVAGNTSIGVYKEQTPDMWIYIRDVPEFQVRTCSAAWCIILVFLQHLSCDKFANESLKA